MTERNQKLLVYIHEQRHSLHRFPVVALLLRMSVRVPDQGLKVAAAFLCLTSWDNLGNRPEYTRPLENILVLSFV
jgi:hypothetical protein